MRISVTNHRNEMITNDYFAKAKIKKVRRTIRLNLGMPDAIVIVMIHGYQVDDDEYLIDCGCYPGRINLATAFIVGARGDLNTPSTPSEASVPMPDNITVPITGETVDLTKSPALNENITRIWEEVTNQTQNSQKQESPSFLSQLKDPPVQRERLWKPPVFIPSQPIVEQVIKNDPPPPKKIFHETPEPMQVNIPETSKDYQERDYREDFEYITDEETNIFDPSGTHAGWNINNYPMYSDEHTQTVPEEVPKPVKRSRGRPKKSDADKQRSSSVVPIVKPKPITGEITKGIVQKLREFSRIQEEKAQRCADETYKIMVGLLKAR